MCFCSDWMLTLWESHLFCNWKQFTWELAERPKHCSALCHYEWQHRNIYVFQKWTAHFCPSMDIKAGFQINAAQHKTYNSQNDGAENLMSMLCTLTGSSLWIVSVLIALNMILELIFWIRYAWKEFSSGTLRSLQCQPVYRKRLQMWDFFETPRMLIQTHLLNPCVKPTVIMRLLKCWVKNWLCGPWYPSIEGSAKFCSVMCPRGISEILAVRERRTVLTVLWLSIHGTLFSCV